MGMLSPLAARAAILAVTFLVSTAIPFLVKEKPVLRFVHGRLGPQIVDRATDAIEKKLGPAAPNNICPPCPEPAPATPDVDVVVPEPAPVPDILPVRVVDKCVDVTLSAAERVWKAAKSIIGRVVGA